MGDEEGKTIKVKVKVWEELMRLKTKLSVEMKRSVTISEVIEWLLEEGKGPREGSS